MCDKLFTENKSNELNLFFGKNFGFSSCLSLIRKKKKFYGILQNGTIKYKKRDKFE